MVPIAVLDFDGIGIAETEAIALSNRLRNELFRLGRFDVVDRGMMTSILEEQGFQQSGCTSNECLVEVGRLLGARQMIGGSVSKVGGTFTVSARLVDVETARVLAVSDFDLRGEVDDMLTRGMAQVAARLSMSTGEIELTPQRTEAEAVPDNATLEPEPATQSPVNTQPPSIRKHSRFKLTAGIPLLGDSGFNVAVGWRPFRGRKVGSLVVTPALAAGLLSYENNDFEDRGGGSEKIYLLTETSADIAFGRLGFGLQAGLGGGLHYYWDGYDGYYESIGVLLTLGASMSVQLGRINLALQPNIMSSEVVNKLMLNIEIR